MNKQELETKKLELEIKKLRIPWYKNIEFWKVFIPTLAVLISLYFTFGRGVLDFEKSKLELQKEQLKLDISRFEIKRDQLSDIITAKDSVKSTLENQIHFYEAQKSDLVAKISILNKKLGISDSEIDKLNSEKAKDKKFYQDELLKEYKAEKERLEELKNLTSHLNQKDVSIASLKAEISYLLSKVKLSDIEISNLQLIKHEATSKELEKQINTFESSIEKLNQKYEAEKKKIASMSPEELLRDFELLMLKFEADNK